ncbi:2Fe-2S iron-sulfur cluster-binding protein [Streptomyces catenulae]|uniref:2Fe-2S iron-sulfur cluster-binding protein n=1 Tax=Streptomyces catenulae TaxID=66875 RepID=A0ABV2Z898_9ACTN|nr:2Fe-2S iron-sulfur cluster-binding protein [Streptomyces catenulae]
MSDDNRRPQSEQGWQPLPQGGEYEQEATAFVQLPEGFTTAALGGDYYPPGADPLAAPGHGYVPPASFTPPIPGAGTDPTATGQWTMPFADPSAGYADPSAGYPAHTGQQAGPTGTPPHGTPWGGEHVEWPVAGGPEAAGGAGQWTVPGAPDDVLEESGEYLVDDGRAPHAPGGYPATGYHYDTAAPGGDPYGGQDTGHPAPDPYGYAPSGDTYGGQGGYGGHPAPQDPLFGGIAEEPYPRPGTDHGVPHDTAHGTGDAYATGAPEAPAPMTPGGGSGHWSLPADALAQWPPAEGSAPAPQAPAHPADAPADTGSWTVPAAGEQPDVSGEFPLDAVRDGAYGTYGGYGTPGYDPAHPEAAHPEAAHPEAAHAEVAHAPGEVDAPAAEPAPFAAEPGTDAPAGHGVPAPGDHGVPAPGDHGAPVPGDHGVDAVPEPAPPVGELPLAPEPSAAPGDHPAAEPFAAGDPYVPGEPPAPQPGAEPAADGPPAADAPGAPVPEAAAADAPGQPAHEPVAPPVAEAAVAPPVAEPGAALHGTPPHGVPVPEVAPADAPVADAPAAPPSGEPAATAPEGAHPEAAAPLDAEATDLTAAAVEPAEGAEAVPGDDAPDPAAPGGPDAAAPEGPEAVGPELAGHAPDAPEVAVPEAAPQVLADSGPDTAGADAYAEEHPHASYVLRVNGADRPVTDAWIGESLLYVLRERLGLAGAKDGCSQGECGACSVQVDGRLVASCLVPAATTAGSEVRTVEGLAEHGRPSDVQRALAESGAVQCGFCIPGMAMTVHDLLEGNHAPSELETRQALCGNLCRCSGYRGVLDAVDTVVASRRRAAEAAAEAEVSEEAAHIPHQPGPEEPAPHGAHDQGPHAPAEHGGAPTGHDPDEPHGPDAPHRTGGPA